MVQRHPIGLNLGIQADVVAGGTAADQQESSTATNGSFVNTNTTAVETPVVGSVTPRPVTVVGIATAKPQPSSATSANEQASPTAVVLPTAVTIATTPVVVAVVVPQATTQPSDTSTVIAVATATPRPIVFGADPAPTVVIENISPQIATVGEVVELKDAYSSVPVSGRAMVAAVNWGDGSGYISAVIVQDTGEIIASHQYSSSGFFTITVRVRIDLGGESIETAAVLVQHPPPTPSATPVPTAVQ
jgi:hypothetical protein